MHKFDDDDKVFTKSLDESLKEVCRLRRSGSKYTVIFQVDNINIKHDEHFILCSFTLKDGTVNKQYTFCKQDVGVFINLLLDIYEYGEPVWNESYDVDTINKLFNFKHKN